MLHFHNSEKTDHLAQVLDIEMLIHHGSALFTLCNCEVRIVYHSQVTRVQVRARSVSTQNKSKNGAKSILAQWQRVLCRKVMQAFLGKGTIVCRPRLFLYYTL